MTDSNRGVFSVALALAVCAAMLYARTLGYEYVWDDLTYLGEFLHYRGSAGAIRAVAEPFYLYPDYYRPLAMLSYVVSAEPAVQHGINAALHALNVVLVFLCAHALIPREAAASRSGLAAAALGALMFAVHPVAVETTAWVSGRFDTLMCSFALGTCLAALGGELTRRRLALVFVFFACAMFSKESAVGLPVALPLMLLLKWRLAGEKAGLREMVRRLVPLLAALALAVALYIAVRLAVVQALFADKATFSGGSLLDKLNVAALAVTEFVKLIVNPRSHSAPLHPFSYEAGSGMLGNTFIVLGCVLVLLVLAALKKPRLNFPLVLLAALAMSWPTLHLIGIPNGENIISDRYALAPLALLAAGLAAAAGTWVVRRVPELGAGGRRITLHAAAACLLWAGTLAAHTNVTIPMWRNEYVLWAFAYRQVPDSDRVHGNYIRALIGKEQWEQADKELSLLLPRVAGKLDLSTITTWMLVRAKVGEYAEAVKISGMGDTLLSDTNPMFLERREVANFYRARGLIDGEAGHWEDAVLYMKKAFELQPTNMRAALQYAHALFMSGEEQQAEEIFESALLNAPEEMSASANRWRESWSKSDVQRK